MNISYLCQSSYSLRWCFMEIAQIFCGTLLEPHSDLAGKRRPFVLFHIFIFCLLRFCSISDSPSFISLSPCMVASWPWPRLFSPTLLSFLTHFFKFRKAELKTVFWGEKAHYFHNCMLSIFYAIFGHHNLFVWFCWHVLFWLLRQRGQKFPVSCPLWRRGLSWAVSQFRG